MGFSWNNFGVLARQSEDDLYLYIHNQNGGSRKIRKDKYEARLPNLRQKIQTLIGQPIIFCTSQNTADWTENKWFSDIDVDQAGLQDANTIIPFSQPVYSGETEPQPAPNVELEAKLAMALKDKAAAEAVATALLKDKDELQAQNKKIEAEYLNKAFAQSERIEQLKSEKSETQDKLSEAEIEISKILAQTKDLTEPFSESDKRQIERDTKQLLAMNLVGTEHSVKARGHPVRELALRLGKVMPKGKINLNVKFIHHVVCNRYRVMLPEFENVEADAFIRLDRTKNMFVASFLNIKSDWFENFELKKGVKDEAYKNRNDLSYEELVEIHKEVLR